MSKPDLLHLGPYFQSPRGSSITNTVSSTYALMLFNTISFFLFIDLLQCSVSLKATTLLQKGFILKCVIWLNSKSLAETVKIVSTHVFFFFSLICLYCLNIWLSALMCWTHNINIFPADPWKQYRIFFLFRLVIWVSKAEPI